MATLITKNSSTASAVPAAGDLVKGELAVNVTDKKVYTKDNSAAVVKLVGSLGNQEANAVAITGGAINGTTIGATTPSTGAFTTASASSGFTGNLTGNVTGNVSGTAANVTGVVAIANGGTGLSALGTGVQSALGQAVTGSGSFVLSTSPSLTTPNLGTPSAAVLTNATGLPLTTGVTGTLGVANGGTGITAFGTGVATALGQNVTGSGGIVLATSPSLTTPNLGTPSAATLTNATGLPISTGVSGLGTGVATALAVATGSAGAFVVNGGALGTPSSGTLTNATGLPISTGVSGLGTGVATALAVNTGSAGAFVVNGGALGTPSSGTVTNLTGTASININGTVGATTPTTGAFTTLSASGNITVSGGTANGVAYLNGSKVLTTGSAVTYDGTTFATTGASNFATSSGSVGIGTSSPTAGYKLDVAGRGKFTNTVNGFAADFVGLSGGEVVIYADNTLSQIRTGGSLALFAGGSEQARLTSTGLGIGTSSPAFKLHVGGAGSQFALISTTDTTSTTGVLFGDSASNTVGRIEYVHSDNGMRFFTNGTTQATLDTSGNLGLGVTPNTWLNSSGFFGKGNIEFLGGTGIIVNFSTDAPTMQLNANGKFSSSWLYKQNGYASRFIVNGSSGGFNWQIAPSGTADTAITFTQAMTLDASGNLGVGATSPAAKVDAFASSGWTGVYTSSGSRFVGIASDSSFANDISWDSSSALRFSTATNKAAASYTERARITSGGKLGLNTSSPSGLFTVYNTTAADFTSQANLENSSAITINSNQATSVVTFQGASGNPDKFIAVDNYGATQFFSLGYQNGATRRNVIQFDQNDTIYFSTAGTERARITSGGYLKASNNGTYTNSTGAYAEFYQSANDLGLIIRNQNASNTANVLEVTADRNTTNNSYYLIRGGVIGVAYRFQVADSGNVTNTNNSYGAISDIKLKENITDATPKLESLNQLRVVNYNFKGSDLKQIGLVAQEVEQVFPGLVETSADRDAEGNDLGTTTKSVKYSVLVPMLLKAVQELTAMNDDLRARVAQLEAK